VSKWTPRPWCWYTSNSYNRLGQDGSYNEILYAVKYKDGVVGIEWKNKADAHLIAAAPDLYEALQVAEESIVTFMGVHDYPMESGAGQILEQVKAALAKARGEG
jgi:hypothetical protein